FAVVDRRRASIESGACNARLQFDWCAPDLLAGLDVESKGPLAVHNVHHAVVDRGRCQLTLVVHDARTPDGYQALDIRFIDLLERAVALSVITHALSRDVFRVLAVVDQLLHGLRQYRRGTKNE